jgi:hypothetical protein
MAALKLQVYNQSLQNNKQLQVQTHGKDMKYTSGSAGGKNLN